MGETKGTNSGRLISLDVFRGFVICVMLVVNNLGDYATSGYFWKHADWITGTQAEAFAAWWASVDLAHWYRLFTEFPIWRHCTAADYVMPWFMLCIGIAMPFSVAAARAKGVSNAEMWSKTIKRALMLVILGWILCYFRDQFAKWLYAPEGTRWTINLGMDVLQLLGVAYLWTRLLFVLPWKWRMGASLLLFAIHWSILRLAYQGPDVPIGTFTAKHNAIGYINSTWTIFRGFDPLWWSPWAGRVTMGFASTMSSIPAAATMLLGSIAGEWLMRRRTDSAWSMGKLAVLGALLAGAGFLIGFDITFNKPRWSPSYLLWTTGVGFMISALIYWWLDERRVGETHGKSPIWTHFFVVMGANSIGAYFVTILAKVLLMNTPRVDLGSAAAIYSGRVLWLATMAVTAGLLIWRVKCLWKVPGYRIVGATLVGVSTAVVMLYGLCVVLWPVAPAAAGEWVSFTEFVGRLLKQAAGHGLGLCQVEMATARWWGNWFGGWVFTAWFFSASWLMLDWAYRRKIFWKV